MTPKLNTEEILSNFVERLPKPVIERQLNNPTNIPSYIVDLPLCLLRVGKFHAGLLLLSCGTRRLTNPDSFDELGCSLVLDECNKCGGFTSAMIKEIRTRPSIDYKFNRKRQ